MLVSSPVWSWETGGGTEVQPDRQLHKFAVHSPHVRNQISQTFINRRQTASSSSAMNQVTAFFDPASSKRKKKGMRKDSGVP